MKPKDAAINFVLLTMSIWHWPSDNDKNKIPPAQTAGRLNRWMIWRKISSKLIWHIYNWIGFSASSWLALEIRCPLYTHKHTFGQVFGVKVNKTSIRVAKIQLFSFYGTTFTWKALNWKSPSNDKDERHTWNAVFFGPSFDLVLPYTKVFSLEQGRIILQTHVVSLFIKLIVYGF